MITFSEWLLKEYGGICRRCGKNRELSKNELCSKCENGDVSSRRRIPLSVASNSGGRTYRQQIKMK